MIDYFKEHELGESTMFLNNRQVLIDSVNVKYGVKKWLRYYEVGPQALHDAVESIIGPRLSDLNDHVAASLTNDGRNYIIIASPYDNSPSSLSDGRTVILKNIQNGGSSKGLSKLSQWFVAHSELIEALDTSESLYYPGRSISFVLQIKRHRN